MPHNIDSYSISDAFFWRTDNKTSTIFRFSNIPEQFFDYGIVTGVIEILEDPEFNIFMDKICHFTKNAIFLTDLLDEYPGGYPRKDLSNDFLKRNFLIKKKHLTFSEPFHPTKLQEPKKIFPILEKQNIWAIRN